MIHPLSKSRLYVTSSGAQVISATSTVPDFSFSALGAPSANSL